MTSRRGFLGLALAAPLAGCRKPVARPAVLEATVNERAVPEVGAVLERSRALEAACAALAPGLSAAALEGAQARWREAALAWKRAYAFRNGPLVTTGAFLQALFWPARAGLAGTLVRGEQPIDETSFRALGVDQKGLFGVEALLFAAAGAPPPVSAAGPEGERARALVALMSRAVSARAAAATRALGDGRAFAAAFAARGQESLSLLCNQFVETIESYALGRLDRLRAPDGRAPRPGEIEGLPSGTAFALPRAVVAATERLYLGPEGRGISDLVAAASSEVDARVRAAFTASLAALDPLCALPPDRTLAAPRPALEKASAALKRLELAIKVEACSVLGVTLTFVAGDGD